MAFYQYQCDQGHAWEHVRPAARRHDPSTCPIDGSAGHKVMSVPVIHWPRSLWNQWSDVYPDTSPREMAKRKDIERYDPTYQHKPTLEQPRLHRYLADRHEAEGASEKLTRQPVEGESPYT